MSAVCLQAAPLPLLRERYPWPGERPAVPAIEWTLDYGGRHLVTQYLRANSARVVVEVGSFLGGSVQTWLRATPGVCVIAIDSWNWLDRWATLLEGVPPDISNQLRRPEGFYETFLRNLWPDRERVIPIRQTSPKALYELAELGVRPDLIYVDADKKGRELDVAHELFPHATIAGDDWWYGRDEGYPIRPAVLDFCRRHGFRLRRRKHTWIIERPDREISSVWRTLWDRATDIPWLLTQVIHPAVRNPRILSEK